MKIRLYFILCGFLILVIFNLAASAQKESPKSIEDALREQREILSGLLKDYQSASGEEKKSLRVKISQANDDVIYLEKELAKKTVSQPTESVEEPESKGVTIVTPVPLGNPPPSKKEDTEPTKTPKPVSGNSGTTATPSITPPINPNPVIDDCNNRTGVFNKRVCSLARSAVQLRAGGGQYKIILDDISAINTVVYSKIANDEAVKKFLLDAEEVRTDKQIGADSMAKGTTSIVVKGGIPTFFNLAYENGAASRTISGSTVTFRVNPVGFTEVLAKRNPFQNGISTLESVAASNNDNYKYLRKLSLGFAFDTTRGQDIPTLTASERQLSAFSVRYEFINERNPRNAKYAKEWSDFFDTEGSSLIEKLTTAEQNGILETDQRLRLKFKNSALNKWFDNTNAALAKLPDGSTIEEVEREIRVQLALLPVEELKKDQVLINSLNQVTLAFIDFQKKQKVLLNKIAKAPIVTFEYTNHREPVLPDTHNFNFIFEKGIPLRKGDDAPVMDVTFNAALTFFNKKPADPTVKRINSFNFSGQLDLPLGGVDPNAMFFGSVLSFAGKYQRVTDNATALDGTVLPNTKGDIWVGQTKVAFSLDRFGLTGVKLPLSFTFANRTELIRENRVRGNFGLTFDIDKFILSRLLK